MPITPGQGQSITTEWKERGISAACTIGLRIFKATVQGKARFGIDRFRYFHFDLNAGGGFNTEANCIGSPVAFMRAAHAQQIDRVAVHLCDWDEAAIRSLLANPEIGQDERCRIHHGDNRGLVPAIPNILRMYGEKPQFAIGSVLADPNGTDIPVEELAALSTLAPRLDFIINVNATAFKRCQRGGEIPDLIQQLNKKHWLIRRPTSRHHFTLLVGRNIPTGDHAALGFFNLSTDIGQHLLRQASLNRTQIEARNTQLDAFKDEDDDGVSKL